MPFIGVVADPRDPTPLWGPLVGDSPFFPLLEYHRSILNQTWVDFSKSGWTNCFHFKLCLKWTGFIFLGAWERGMGAGKN